MSPRLGVAYDLFGNGKTALKASVGRYNVIATTNLSRVLVSPVNFIVQSATRSWADANGNFAPDCDLQSFAANGECGALSNNKFGTVNQTRRISRDVLEGFGVRYHDWQTSAGLQQEIRQGMAFNVTYYRTSYANFSATPRGTGNQTEFILDNLAVTPEDYDPYCVTAPVNSRLPGGGGNQLCGLYDIRPAKFGQVDELVVQQKKYGKRTEVFNGVDVALNARFGKGGLVNGGVAVGRTATEDCGVIDSPQQARPGWCKVTPPWSALTQVKFAVIYPLPWGVQTSATYQNLPGIPITATSVYTSAAVAPSLGRNLGGGPASTVTVDLIPPQTMFEDRLNQIDLRFSKKVKVGRARFTGAFDLYNALNTSTILGIRTAYGPTWLQPTRVLTPRFAKFGAQFEF